MSDRALCFLRRRGVVEGPFVGAALKADARLWSGCRVQGQSDGWHAWGGAGCVGVGGLGFEPMTILTSEAHDGNRRGAILRGAITETTLLVAAPALNRATRQHRTRVVMAGSNCSNTRDA